MEIFSLLFKDFQMGRLIESLIFLAVLMTRVKPHMKKLDDRMGAIETSVKTIVESVTQGFQSGETRFGNIEGRLDKIEKTDHPIKATVTITNAQEATNGNTI